MKIPKGYITLEISETSEKIFENIKKILSSIVPDEDIEFTNNPHITLDDIENIELKNVIQKIKHSQTNIHQDIIDSAKNIEIGKFESFISNKNGKKIFYLNILGGEIFFEHLRKMLYSVQIPHCRVFETNTIYSQEKTNTILQKLNNNHELTDHIKKLFLDKDNIYIRNKPQGKESEIIEVLKLKNPE